MKGGRDEICRRARLADVFPHRLRPLDATLRFPGGADSFARLNSCDELPCPTFGDSHAASDLHIHRGLWSNAFAYHSHLEAKWCGDFISVPVADYHVHAAAVQKGRGILLSGHLPRRMRHQVRDADADTLVS
jgi:hypothetical protein